MNLPHGLCPVIHVSDLERSLGFYTEVLGFAEEFRFEGRYAGVVAGKVSFHVSQGGGEYQRPVGAGNLYFLLDSPADVDAYYARVTERGVTVDRAPQNYPYGMRDFAFFDPDGNLVSFGAEVSEDGNYLVFAND